MPGLASGAFRAIRGNTRKNTNVASDRCWYDGCYHLPQENDRMSPSLNLLNRVRGEFIEMPGLRLRLDEAQRLWNLDRASCELLLRSLVDAKFLNCENEAYRRV
jgi:hypothetical protein